MYVKLYICRQCNRFCNPGSSGYGVPHILPRSTRSVSGPVSTTEASDLKVGFMFVRLQYYFSINNVTCNYNIA
jgi:hypothetical protein